MRGDAHSEMYPTHLGYKVCDGILVSSVLVIASAGVQLPMAVTIRSDGPAHPTLIDTGAGFVFHVHNCGLLDL